VQVSAFDTAYPTRKVYTDVEVTVTRNPYGPEFDQQSYDKSIAEIFPIGGSVLQVTATDQDQVSAFTQFNSLKSGQFWLNGQF